MKTRKKRHKKLNELEKAILRLSWKKRTAAIHGQANTPDLLEWEILRDYFGFPLQKRCGDDTRDRISFSATLGQDKIESSRFLDARQSIVRACRVLHDRGLIVMGGPGSPSMANCGDLIRGWGWNAAEMQGVYSSLFPHGAWDTVTLTPEGMALAADLIDQRGC